jgi:hypothetical protein
MERIAATTVQKNRRQKLMIYRTGPRFTVTQANTVRAPYPRTRQIARTFLNEGRSRLGGTGCLMNRPAQRPHGLPPCIAMNDVARVDAAIVYPVDLQ